MKVLMVKQGEIPHKAELDGLKSMQAAIGGLIEPYYPFDDPVALVRNDEGEINGLPLNRAVFAPDGKMLEIIASDFFVTGLDDEGFTDLPEKLMQKYAEIFKYPEEFVLLNGELTVLHCSVDLEQDAAFKGEFYPEEIQPAKFVSGNPSIEIVM